MSTHNARNSHPRVHQVGPDLAATEAALAHSRADYQTTLGTIGNQPRGDMVNPGPLELALEKAEREKAIWVRLASSALEDLIASGSEFSADDVREAMPEGLEPHHPNAWGALFNGYRREGLIELAGYRQSTTKSRNGGVLRMWRGAAGATCATDPAGTADQTDPTDQTD